MAIALIGFGAVARYAAAALAAEPETRPSAVLTRAGRADAARAALGADLAAVERAEALPETISLALDCAGREGLAQHGAALLARGIDVITVSTGAFADDALSARLEAAARGGGASIELASGAIGAVDALAAAAVGGLDRVVYRGRKPPAGWRGSPAEDVLDLDALTAPAPHFQGSAREAARRYPKNANVAATVALAGLGLDATRAELIADPGVAANIHEVEAEGAFGQLHLRIEGRALPGAPRSSALTAMSLVRAVRRRRAALRL